MTVVASPVQQPTTQPVTERERRARILEAAALEIEVRGWTFGSFCDDAGVCALGALAASVFGDPNGHRLCREDWYRIDAVWGDCAPYLSVTQNLWEWNDTPGRTAAEVTFLLRWRACEIRAGL